MRQIIRNKKGQFIKGINPPNGYDSNKRRKNYLHKFVNCSICHVKHSSGGKYSLCRRCFLGLRKIGKIKSGKPFLSGENHWAWKGGKTILRDQIENLKEYKQWRSNVFERDNWTCQTCHKRGSYLESHHIKEFYKIIDEFKIKNIQDAIECKELWDIDNGIALCIECHELTKKGRKSNHDRKSNSKLQ